jgi:transposase-like protein
LKKEKPKQKLQMLLSMHSVISGLYNDGYSSREIEKILLKRYKKEISHTYVNTYIKEYVSDKEN